MALAKWHGTITDLKGNVLPNAQIYVVNEASGGVAQLYSDRNGTVGLGNPFTADSEGFAGFHVVGGAYRITARLGGYERVWRYVGIGTAQETDIGEFGSGEAGWDAVEQTPAGLASHTGAAIGFRVLVVNAADNRSAIYEKTGAGASWTNPIFVTGSQGAPGAANELVIGSVVEGAASATITGSVPQQVLNLSIPRGDDGEAGPPNVLGIGTVTGGTTASATITGQSPNQQLNLVLPRGPQGDPGAEGPIGDVTPEALAAKAAAEAARDAAVVAKGEAESSASDASTSASTATSKANDASDSAAAALVSENAAASSASGASASAGAAASSASTASSAASTATAQATIATTQAGNAATSATDADASATTAQGAASTATTQAGIASTQASDAAASAIAAANSASAAAASEQSVSDDADAASIAASEAATSASTASAQAGIATTKAGEAAASATAAGTSASDAAGSAVVATDKAGEAAASASSASGSSSTATTQAGIATGAATDAETARDYAYEWSSADVDDPVDDGIHSGFSAYHWSVKAQIAAGGGVQSVNGHVGPDVVLTATDVGAATSAQGAKADTALQTLTAGTAITITGTGTSRTINAVIPAQVQSDWNASSGLGQILNKPTLAAVATSGSYNDLSNRPTIPAPQVNADWNASSGVAQILNKPTLGTAAAQNVGAFATAAQGAKADTALQTLTQGANITITGTGTSRTIAATVPPAPVTSVNSKTGAVVLNAADVGALPGGGKAADSSLLNGQNAAQLPISTATQTALNGKQDSLGFTPVNKAGDTGLIGFTSAGYSLGNLTGTVTPNAANGNFQYANKNANFTLAAPADGYYSMQIGVTNTSVTGALTATGFNKVHGDFRSANGAKHMLLINVSGIDKVLTIVEAS